MNYRLAFLLGTSISLSQSLAYAQFVPITDLTSTQATTTTPVTVDNSASITGFEAPPEGGSETVANFLKRLEPSVDTRLPETATESANRINRLISRGLYDNALREIAKIQPADAYLNAPSIDVQLRFLEARAYAGKGQTGQAIKIYRDMTFKYPELAEPWNNMAVLQIKAGSLDEALESLQNALLARPNYPIANQNIALIYMALAQQSFQKAAKGGVKNANSRAQQVQQLLDGTR